MADTAAKTTTPDTETAKPKNVQVNTTLPAELADKLADITVAKRHKRSQDTVRLAIEAYVGATWSQELSDFARKSFE